MLHLHVTQAVGFEHRVRLMHGVFGLTISEGVIAVSRAAAVVTHLRHAARPEVRVAGRYGGQQGHGAVRQMCLAHPLPDTTYAAEAGQ